MSGGTASVTRDGQEPRTLILVRHGETSFNAEGRFRGRADPPLTEHGRRQARAAANALAAYAGALLASSPRARARETAEVIAHVLRTSGRVEDPLDDLDYGEWTGLGRAEVIAQWPAQFALWLEAPERLRVPGGERVTAVRDRVWAAMDELARGPSTVVVVTHDVCIRLAICALLDAPLVSMHALRVDLASFTEFAFGDDSIQLVRVNDTSHLRDAADHEDTCTRR